MIVVELLVDLLLLDRLRVLAPLRVEEAVAQVAGELALHHLLHHVDLEEADREQDEGVVGDAQLLERREAGALDRGELDAVRVKGKREPVKIYELLGSGTPTDNHRQLMDNFHEALGYYREQRWDDAIKLFNHVRTLKSEDFTSGVYITRCEAMRHQPPGPDWDGVFTMTTK